MHKQLTAYITFSNLIFKIIYFACAACINSICSGALNLAVTDTVA